MPNYKALNTMMRLTAIETDDCIIWPMRKDKDGYGILCVNYKIRRVHRWAMERRLRHNLDTGELVLHSCNNPSCVNYRHLRVGTQKENIQDKVDCSRQVVGTNVNTCKLTEEQVINIRKDPRTQRKIAKDYNISQVNVGQIKRGETWKHLLYA